MGGQNSIGGNVGVWARNGFNRKASHRGHRGHRGELGLVGQNSIGATWASGREIRCNRKASHRGHGGHRGELGLVGQNSIGGNVGVWARNPVRQKKHRTEVTEGDLGSVAKILSVVRGRLCEKSGATEKHRTEVTEGDRVWWSKILSATAWASGREIIKRNGQA
jgi:hypothetical protein